jgi:transcriptional regulator with XRE-family HTH domain
MSVAAVSERLRVARERAGRTPEELAARIGITTAWYYDLEGQPEEVSTTLSLAQLYDLASALELDLRHLLLGEEAPPLATRPSAGDFVERLRSKVAASGKSPEELGAEIGWDIGRLLRTPESLWELNLDGLRDVCAFAGVDWTTLLASAPG